MALYLGRIPHLMSVEEMNGNTCVPIQKPIHLFTANGLPKRSLHLNRYLQSGVAFNANRLPLVFLSILFFVQFVKFCFHSRVSVSQFFNCQVFGFFIG